MLQPRKQKYRKEQKGKSKGIAQRGVFLNYGKYGIIALEPGRIRAKQIESARVAVKRKIRLWRNGKMWLRIYPHRPVTKKPTEVRMGQGKGSVDRWVAKVKAKKVLIEISKEIPKQIALAALKAAGHKFNVSTKIIENKKY